MTPALRQALLGPPGWVRALSPGSTPSLALDFANARYWGPQTFGAPDALPGWSFSRTGVEYAATSSGLLVPFASGVPADTDLGLQVWEARTNACTNTNINPADTTNLTTSGDAAAVLTVVTDTAALAAIGLTGKAFKLDNSLGVATADVIINGTTGSASNASVSAHVRATAGTARIRFNGANLASTTSAAYSRLKGENQVTAGTDKLIIRADAASVVFFVANQLETGATTGPVIPVAGASATRGAASASVGYVPGASGTILAIFRPPLTFDGNARRIVGTSAASDNAPLFFYGTGPMRIGTWNGSVEMTQAATLTGGGRTKAALTWDATGRAISVGGSAPTSDANGVGSFTTLNPGCGKGVAGTEGDLIMEALIVYPNRVANSQLQALTA